MVRVDTALSAIRRGIEDSGRLPAETSYLERKVDREGEDAAVPLPAVVVQELATRRDQNRSTDMVGLVRDDGGSVIGRIFEIGFRMEVQIDVWTVAGSSYDIGDLTRHVKRALQRYDSSLRDDFFPDGDGGTVADLHRFELEQGQPNDDLSDTPSVRRRRLRASAWFTDELNEVDEYGPLEPIKTVRTPRHGDYDGDLSEDYELEYQA